MERDCRYGLPCLVGVAIESVLDGHLAAKVRHIRRNTASRRDFLFCTYRK